MSTRTTPASAPTQRVRPVSGMSDPRDGDRSDGLFTSGIGCEWSGTGDRKLWAKFGLGHGEIKPMSIAAISLGMCIIFAIGGCVALIEGQPLCGLAVFVLAFFQALGAICLAGYKIRSTGGR